MKVLGWNSTVSWRGVWSWLSLTMMAALVSLPMWAQMPEVKEKPPLYTYVSNWTIPRAQWGDVEKTNKAEEAIFQKALTKGLLSGYGYNRNLIHQAEAPTHDDWFCSMSLAGLLEVLGELNITPDPPVILNSTKHMDGVYVSRYYNWKPGTYKDAYTQISVYKIKSDAADNAFDVLAKNVIAPLMEKLLADGIVLEYEVDQEAFHSEEPSKFALVYMAPRAEDLDKVHAAIRAAMAANPATGITFAASTDYSVHRDYLMRGDATYK